METHFENMKTAEDPGHRLAQDLKSVVRDAEDLMQATAGDLGEKAKAARSRLVLALDRAKASCRDMEDKAIAAAKSADKVIRAHPYESMGVAFAAGLLIGVLVARK